MTKPIVFIDTETTGLHARKLPWEIAMIRIDNAQFNPDNRVQRVRMFIRDIDLTEADSMALEIGKFYERHPGVGKFGNVVGHLPPHADADDLCNESHAMRFVEWWTRGATLVGANPAFDAQLLDSRMRAHGLCPSWHHRLVDVEALTAGHLRVLDEANRMPGLGKCAQLLDIEVDKAAAHTAMGDAELAMKIFLKLMDIS